MCAAKVAQKGPYEIELEPGEYWWCACGQSEKQPFCDGAHEDTEFRPIQVKIEQRKQVYLCGCKQSKDAPFCDGSHNDL